MLLRASYTEKGQSVYQYIKPDQVAAYKVTNGNLMDLMATDEETGQYVINTFDLSEIMEDIYNDYDALSEEDVKNE